MATSISADRTTWQQSRSRGGFVTKQEEGMKQSTEWCNGGTAIA
jgi:hypothetical protein